VVRSGPWKFIAACAEKTAVVKRTAFLGMGAGAATLAALSPEAQASVTPLAPNGGSALVLTGGGARGAYQAGAIIGLADHLGLHDGEPFEYEMIAGTSIGALNGYYVATAQYSRLRKLWQEIPARRVFRLKPQFAKIPVESSGVGTRFAQALALALGLLTTERGALDRSILSSLLDELIDPRLPVHIPLCWSATNLTRGSGEVFYLPATTGPGLERQARVDRLLDSRARLQRKPRLAQGEILHDALLASVLLPIVFDPVAIPSEDVPPRIEEYVDGGIVNNAAIGIAQRVATLVQVIGCDTFQHEDETYRNGLDLAMGCFGIMQRTVTLYATSLAFAESIIVSDDPKAAKSSGFADESLPLRIEYILPEKLLPGDVADFDNAPAIEHMLERGYDDALRGWEYFQPSLFLTNI
jgi:predicted acylesterase/phospholipase RssA